MLQPAGLVLLGLLLDLTDPEKFFGTKSWSWEALGNSSQIVIEHVLPVWPGHFSDDPATVRVRTASGRWPLPYRGARRLVAAGARAAVRYTSPRWEAMLDRAWGTCGRRLARGVAMMVFPEPPRGLCPPGMLKACRACELLAC